MKKVKLAKPRKPVWTMVWAGLSFLFWDMHFDNPEVSYLMFAGLTSVLFAKHVFDYIIDSIDKTLLCECRVERAKKYLAEKDKAEAERIEKDKSKWR